MQKWLKRVLFEIEILELKASIQYNISGIRYNKIRERFWNRFTELMSNGDLEQANLCIEAFMALRKYEKFRGCK
jgi:hypothetical protein